jgi:hypothetical protein
VGIGRPTLEVKLLGGVVSQDKGFIKGLAMKKAFRATELMHLLPQLQDPQIVWVPPNFSLA